MSAATIEKRLNIGDTAELYSYLPDTDQTVDPDDIIEVIYTVRLPDNTRETVEGEVQDDGAGYLQYTNTQQAGEYRVLAAFTLTTGEIQSISADFQVIDPFVRDLRFSSDISDYQTLTTDEDRVAWQVMVLQDRVWDKMENLWDSADGGPWMRDMTLNVFSPETISNFIEEALFDINVYNPPTDFWIDMFATPIFVQGQPGRQNTNLTILVQGTWIAVIRHLMRSYTEQPLPQGGQVTYEDRRDYLQRWGTIYQIEFQHYDHLVKMWKRQFLGLHQSKMLVSSKAGRLLPAPLRSRNIGRGYY